MSDSPDGRRSKFSTYAWAFLGYLIAVILFGAWVRITHSGAGCGAHWPTCRGSVVPMAPSTETIIEYTHRVTSGLLGVLGAVLVGWAWRRFGSKHRVFWASVVTMVFIGLEALIGAGLVLGELVATDDSVARAVVIAIHLVNTLSLTGAASLAAWWSTGARRPRVFGSAHPPAGPSNDPTSIDTSAAPSASTTRPAEDGPAASRSLTWLLGLGVIGLVATSMSGAVTALGDTLFPVDPTVAPGLLERVRADLSPAKHFLVRLRIIHPIIAAATSFYLVALTSIVRTSAVSQTAKSAAGVLLGGVLLQVGIGAVNIYLGAPGWMQLVHLAVAQGVWIMLLVTANEALSRRDDDLKSS